MPRNTHHDRPEGEPKRGPAPASVILQMVDDRDFIPAGLTASQLAEAKEILLHLLVFRALGEEFPGSEPDKTYHRLIRKLQGLGDELCPRVGYFRKAEETTEAQDIRNFPRPTDFTECDVPAPETEDEDIEGVEEIDMTRWPKVLQDYRDGQWPVVLLRNLRSAANHQP